MTDHPIALALKASLGADVAVVLDDPSSPRVVTIYRPDPLSDDFVASALSNLAAGDAGVLVGIESVLVTFETPLGPSRRRVAMPGDAAAARHDVAA